MRPVISDTCAAGALAAMITVPTPNKGAPTVIAGKYQRGKRCSDVRNNVISTIGSCRPKRMASASGEAGRASTQWSMNAKPSTVESASITLMRTQRRVSGALDSRNSASSSGGKASDQGIRRSNSRSTTVSTNGELKEAGSWRGDEGQAALRAARRQPSPGYHGIAAHEGAARETRDRADRAPLLRPAGFRQWRLRGRAARALRAAAGERPAADPAAARGATRGARDRRREPGADARRSGGRDGDAGNGRARRGHGADGGRRARRERALRRPAGAPVPRVLRLRSRPRPRRRAADFRGRRCGQRTTAGRGAVAA